MVNGQPGATRSGGREVEIAVAVFVAVMLGPFTLIAGLVLAVVGQSWRRLWLAATSLPGLGGAVVLPAQTSRRPSEDPSRRRKSHLRACIVSDVQAARRAGGPCYQPTCGR